MLICQEPQRLHYQRGKGAGEGGDPERREESACFQGLDVPEMLGCVLGLDVPPDAGLCAGFSCRPCCETTACGSLTLTSRLSGVLALPALEGNLVTFHVVLLLDVSTGSLGIRTNCSTAQEKRLPCEFSIVEDSLYL